VLDQIGGHHLEAHDVAVR